MFVICMQAQGRLSLYNELLSCPHVVENEQEEQDYAKQENFKKI